MQSTIYVLRIVIIDFFLIRINVHSVFLLICIIVIICYTLFIVSKKYVSPSLKILLKIIISAKKTLKYLKTKEVALMYSRF